MGHKTTMDEVARELGLSKSLVSRAINDKYGVNDETRSRIKMAALKMGYKLPSVTNKTPGRAESATIVVESHDLTDIGFWTKIIDGIEKSLNKKGISVFLSSFENGVDEFVPLSIKQMKSDGIFILGSIPMSVVLSVTGSGLPAVHIDSNYTNLKFDHVLANNYFGAYEATEYLLHEDHQKIGFIGSTCYSYSFSERFRGFTDCMNRNNLGFAAAYNVTEMHDEYKIPFSTKKLRSLLKSKDVPTAFVCANDISALVAYDIIQEAGLKIPDEISMIGFDNIEKCNWVTPSLSTINIPKEQMGERAVDMLLQRIMNPERSAEQLLVGTEIVKRNSVRKIVNDTNEKL